MFRFASGIILPTLLLSGLLLALRQPVSPSDPLNPHRLEFELRFLASDELGGRATGSPEANTAARFIAESFRTTGVQPALGKDGFLQVIDFQRTTPPNQISIRIGTHLFDPQQIAWLGGTGEIKAPARFSESWNDGLRGKIWLSPLSLRSGPGKLASELANKLRQATAGGALALVHVLSDPEGWGRLRSYLAGSRVELAEGKESGIPHLLLAGVGGSSSREQETTIQVAQPGVENFTSSNVAGIINGTDVELGKEYIALVAHYDHLGRAEPATSAAGQDLIYNGARDNGMGVVALLGAARALSQNPPRRSLLLLAVTGEEEGLLGSRYFVENSAVPLDRIRFVLNADGAGFTDTHIVTIIGFDRTDGSQALRQAAADFGLEAIPEPKEASDLFARSDNYNFAKKGIPALTFSPGFRHMDQNLMKYYHQTSDEADDNFDYNYLVEFVQVFARSARYLAGSDHEWKWTEGDPFEETARTLYGLP